MAREKKKVLASSVSASQMEKALSNYAQHDAEMQRLTAILDKKIAALREEIAPELSALQMLKDEEFEVVQAYALENRDELFTKKKSIETVFGSFGFRTGTPKLKTKKGLTWGGVLELLRVHAPEFIRVKEDVAKDNLLAERNSPEVEELMPRIGVEVVQDETFFIDLKKEGEE